MRVKRRKSLPCRSERAPFTQMASVCMELAIGYLDLSAFANLTASCTLLHKLPAAIKERKYKQLYFINFEPESIAHNFINPDGPSTSWQKRYRKRFEVEINQSQGWARIVSCDNVLYPLHVDMTAAAATDHLFCSDWGLEIVRTWHTCERLRWNGYLLVYDFAAPVAELDLYPAIARITVE